MLCYRKFKPLFLLFILPLAALSQDTAFLKKQATRFAKASFNGDYNTVIDLSYPKLVALSGGREEMHKLITERVESLKKQGVISFDGYVDHLGEFYRAGEQTHCLIPETLVLKMFNGRYVTRSYLLAISDDKGENWTFLDVGNMPKEVLLKLLPNFNPDLEIPSAGKPLFFPDRP